MAVMCWGKSVIMGDLHKRSAYVCRVHFYYFSKEENSMKRIRFNRNALLYI